MSWRTKQNRFLLMTTVLLACASFVGAQVQTGRIFGQVTDRSGAVMPGVKVTLTGPAILQPVVVTASDAGTYQFPGIPTGTYSVRFEANGFRPILHEGVRIDIGFNAEINGTLEVASASTSG